MTAQQLKIKTSSLHIRYRSGYDCSEYAEDVLSELGVGKIVTYEATNNGRKTQFNTMFFGHLSEPFLYHTVVLVQLQFIDYIVDATNPKILWYRQDYEMLLKKINNGLYFNYYRGCYKG